MNTATLGVLAAVLLCSASAAAQEVSEVEWVEAVLAGEEAVPPAVAARGFGRLMKAAEAGSGTAQYGLGLLFLAGRVVTQDDVTAAHWLARAAEGGVAEAQSNLGLLYLHGRGVPRDPQVAAELLRRAAAQNVVAAQHNLGWMAQVGEGVAKDAKAAAGWYAAAAQSGYSQSQYNLGVLLASAEADGLRDPAAAVKWFALAGLSPHPDVRRRAAERLVELSRETPPLEVAEGLEQARAWLAAGGRVY
jgi:TPR repeat protein